MGPVMGQLTERGAQTARPGRHGDGGGLHLVVSATGRKKWVLRYRISGVRKDKGLGSYPNVGLKDARTKAAEHRALIGKGIDPIEAERASGKAARPVPTFEDIAKLVIADAQKKSVNAKVRYQWERHLGAAYCEPLLARPVHEITIARCRGRPALGMGPSRRSRASSIRPSGACSSAPASSSGTSMASRCLTIRLAGMI